MPSQQGEVGQETNVQKANAALGLWPQPCCCTVLTVITKGLSLVLFSHHLVHDTHKEIALFNLKLTIVNLRKKKET